MVETVAEAPADASATDHLTIASDPRSRTPTSGLACSRSTSHSTAHTPPVPFTASLPSVEEAVPLSESAGLLTARSPVASEHGVSAPTSLPPTTISQSATLPIPGRSQSPNVFKTRQTATPILSDTRHHDPVTPVPPAATEPPEDPSIPVAQDFSGYHMQEKQGTEEASMQQPPTLVPAFWAAVTGRRSADIETIEFFVDDATADATRNWARRKETFSFEHKHVVVHLLCLPEDAVSECYQNMSPSATREDIVAAMWNIKTEWPPAGTLVVQTDPPGSSWVPGHDSGPLELTHAIKRGMNRFRLIQLTDMSNKLFVIHATEPSAEERKAVGALTVGWTQTLAKLAPHSPRRTSEPVAVRASVVA
ncbi:hypothetical protein BV20DRAFT_1037341 [Pilatotrama ljubarskyi]|nr:hypothetical protein BV20DRAFT_1037341 [Pilatotrama ljubarskyi]